MLGEKGEMERMGGKGDEVEGNAGALGALRGPGVHPAEPMCCSLL